MDVNIKLWLIFSKTIKITFLGYQGVISCSKTSRRFSLNCADHSVEVFSYCSVAYWQTLFQYGLPIYTFWPGLTPDCSIDLSVSLLFIPTLVCCSPSAIMLVVTIETKSCIKMFQISADKLAHIPIRPESKSLHDCPFLSCKVIGSVRKPVCRSVCVNFLNTV